MFRPRVIPVLLLKGNGLVKSVRFKDFRYIGDPINAVRIFNDFKADELVFLDILASKEKRSISLDFVKNVGDEANMPFAVGGGINTINTIREILHAGAEKVVIGTEAALNPSFIARAADAFGSSTISVCIDVKKKFLGKEQVWVMNGSKATGILPEDFALMMQQQGAGEIIIQSIEREGTFEGYDLELIHRVSSKVSIPIVALGGARNFTDFRDAIDKGHASAVAAGSRFVYHGPRNAVLINYPAAEEMKQLFTD